MKLSENNKILIKQKVEQLLRNTTDEQNEDLANIPLAKDKIFNYIVSLLETKTNK